MPGFVSRAQRPGLCGPAFCSRLQPGIRYVLHAARGDVLPLSKILCGPSHPFVLRAGVWGRPRGLCCNPELAERRFAGGKAFYPAVPGTVNHSQCDWSPNDRRTQSTLCAPGLKTCGMLTRPSTTWRGNGSRLPCRGRIKLGLDRRGTGDFINLLRPQNR